MISLTGRSGVFPITEMARRPSEWVMETGDSPFFGSRSERRETVSPLGVKARMRDSSSIFVGLPLLPSRLGHAIPSSMGRSSLTPETANLPISPVPMA